MQVIAARTPWTRMCRVAVVLAALSSLVVAAPPARAVNDRAEIIIAFVEDATPWPPAARTAFRYAADRWETMIYSSFTIKIRADWRPMAEGYLGSAAPNGSYHDVPGMPRANTLYPIALANQLVGFDLNGAAAEVDARFNANLTNWDFGTDGNPDAGDFDFVTVVMHELGHGLGFGGFMNYNPTTDRGFWTDPSDPNAPPGIYDRFTTNRTDVLLVNYAQNSVALGNALTSNAVYWTGPRGTAYNGAERPRMYAPTTWQGGSSYGHLNESTYPPNTRNGLMTPQGSIGEVMHNPGPIVLGIFQDMGWPLGIDGRATVARTTILRATVSDSSITDDQTVTIRGALTRGPDGAPVVNRTVKFFKRLVGATQWTLVTTRTTNENGRVSLLQAPNADTQYRLLHSGSGTTDGDYSRTVTVNVA